nr:VOC family protein [Rhizobium sp. P32RR-XVIII]
MTPLALHHVAIITHDLGKSLPFYRGVFSLTEIPRPNFPVGGALWCLQVHLMLYPEASFRRTPRLAATIVTSRSAPMTSNAQSGD